MRRSTHPDVNGIETTGRLDRPHDADHDITGAGPSYVESVLFARRPMRRPMPGASPQSTSSDKARVATEPERN
jgi:hypothetical protein